MAGTSAHTLAGMGISNFGSFTTEEKENLSRTHVNNFLFINYGSSSFFFVKVAQFKCIFKIYVIFYRNICVFQFLSVYLYAKFINQFNNEDTASTFQVAYPVYGGCSTLQGDGVRPDGLQHLLEALRDLEEAGNAQNAGLRCHHAHQGGSRHCPRPNCCSLTMHGGFSERPHPRCGGHTLRVGSHVGRCSKRHYHFFNICSFSIAHSCGQGRRFC
jgi:hypothetical protein